MSGDGGLSALLTWFGPQVYVDGLVKSTVGCAEDVAELLAQGSSLRAVAATNMNSQSSRSHAIVQIHMAEGATGDRVCQLNLVDLAGSENAARSGSAGARIAEGRAINRSVLCLARCSAWPPPYLLAVPPYLPCFFFVPSFLHLVT